MLYSRGAEGADLEFTTAALRVGHKAMVISTETGSDHVPRDKTGRLTIQRHSDKVLARRLHVLQRTSIALRRNVTKHFVRQLLLRSAVLVESVTSMYAVGLFDSPKHPGSVNLSGGTAWTCQMFVNKYMDQYRASLTPTPLEFASVTTTAAAAGLNDKPENPAPQPQPPLPINAYLQLYLYELNERRWFQCRATVAQPRVISWVPLEEGVTPPPFTGSYAGIGSRRITADARKAINSLYGKNVAAAVTVAAATAVTEQKND